MHNKFINGFKIIKKNIFKILLCLLIVYVIYSYASVEIKTALYGDEFEEAVIGAVYDDSQVDYYKVFKYSKNYAVIYCVDDISGYKQYFKKADNQWVRITWDVIWSRQGSADGIPWPYYK